MSSRASTAASAAPVPLKQDARTIGPCAHLLFVAKNIERIGDHCTNIAEMVHYLVTGEELVRDRPKRTEQAAMNGEA